MYLYGFPQIDVEENGQVFDSETMNLLILCMGVMYGVVGQTTLLRQWPRHWELVLKNSYSAGP